MFINFRFLAAIFCLTSPFAAGPGARAEPLAPQEAGRRLMQAYPDHIVAVDGNEVVWRDGNRMTIDDGRGPKSFEALLGSPDLEDIFAIPYPVGDAVPPGVDVDPGRARPAAFFDRMYGNCREGGVADNLVEVDWMPSRGKEKLKITRVNGVADKIKAISTELEALPESFDVYLRPIAGTYVCRVIAGTNRPSAHGHGIAIDIALKHSHYWRWSKPDASGAPFWRNEIPMEIVRIFEKHGFIWGGRWYHFDTMHFEYRPELLIK
jgi:hypothetical protein